MGKKSNIYRKSTKSDIATRFLYLLDFYRGFTAFTDFQEDINVNIVTMRNDVTSGVTSGVSNVTLKLLTNGIITKSGQ